MRASTRPSRIGELWGHAARAADDAGGYAHATPARGIVRCVLPAPSDAASAEQLRATLRAIANAATLIGERLPASLWNVAPRSVAIDALTTGVRRAFDPDGIMNVGLLGACT